MMINIVTERKKFNLIIDKNNWSINKNVLFIVFDRSFERMTNPKASKFLKQLFSDYTRVS